MSDLEVMALDPAVSNDPFRSRIAGWVFTTRAYFADRPLLAFMAAIVLALVATGLRALLNYPKFAPFLPFYAAMTVTGLFCGRGPGYFCAVTGCFLALSPTFFASLGQVGIHEIMAAVALFSVMCVVAVETVCRLASTSEALIQREFDLLRRSDLLAVQLAELQTLYDHAPVGIAFLDTKLRFIRINTALAEMNGSTVEEHIGNYVWDLVPDLEETAMPLFRRVLETGETLTDMELSGETRSQPGVIRFWRESFYPVPAKDGSILGIGIICEEITELHRAREREQLLMREVDHRARNLLTIVQSVVKLSKWTGSHDAFKEAINGRIQALARIHTLLASNRWNHVTIAEVIRLETAPFGESVQVEDGPGQIMLSPSAAQSLSMILHELATNCVKHGALSASGTARVAWQLDGGAEPRVQLVWTESGGPPVEPPQSTGFGTTLIRTTVESGLSGQLMLDFAPAGLECRLNFPLSKAGKAQD